MIEVNQRQHTLACMEVWGGNRCVVRTVELPELTAWVYSEPLGAESGGDVHYLSVCGQALLSRIVLADVGGHGAQVSVSAQLLHALVREHINTWETLIQLEPDDILVLYTDGITEAQDGFGDMVGRSRLMAWARMAPIDTPASTGQFLLTHLNEFRGAYFTDDETIIAIQRTNKVNAPSLR